VLYWEKGLYKESEENYIKALSLLQPGIEKDDYTIASVNCNLSYLYNKSGKYDQAIQLLEDSIRIIKGYVGEEHSEQFHALHALVAVYLTLKRNDEVEATLLKIDKIISKLPDSHQFHYHTLVNFTILYRNQKRYAESEDIFRKMLENFKTAPFMNNLTIANNMVELAYNQFLQNKLDEAEASYLQTLEFQLQEDIPESQVKVRTFNNLALVYLAQDRYIEAEKGFRDAMALLDKLGITTSLNCAVTRSSLAKTYIKLERWTDAELALSQALQIYGNKNETASYLSALQGYALILEKLGRQAEADEYKAKAEELKARLECQNTEIT
jgi:tetratricopeptide (TPR) repeat protein